MKKFILNSTNISKDSYVWNLFGSLILAFQSVIFLMIITRAIGLEEAGVFTFAYANANLFFLIGKYGMKPFQASDQKEQYPFAVYFASRVITSFIMLVLAVFYLIYSAQINNYPSAKLTACIVICIFKIPDTFEDVFFGRLQQKGRMDIAAKAMTLRGFLITVFFSIIIIISKNLLFSSILSTIFSMISLTAITFWIMPLLKKGGLRFHIKQVIDLLKNCFPLFLGSFLALYISNAPKYSIDRILDDKTQACYGFLSMPVLIIGLLNGIIFNPIIPEMSTYWLEKQFPLFFRKIFKQILIIILISFACILCAYCFGTEILSFMYNADLFDYKKELIILLIGGSLYGLSGLLSTLITIIRFQKSIALSYIIVSTIALFFSDLVIQKYNLRGAAVLYAILMGILCICFIILLLVGIVKYLKNEKKRK